MPPIAHDAKRVDRLFRQVAEALRQGNFQNDVSQGISKSEVSDTLGRYRIWTGNIGVFQQSEPKSSLSFRIRDAPKIRGQITELLDDIAESLDDAYQIVSNARENRTAPHLSSTESLDVQQNQEEQRGRDGSDSEEELSEIREIFDSVGDTVKNFLRLSIIIRNSTNRDRYSRAASAAMTSPYNEQFDIDHVRHKFPELEKSNKVWLIQRLGRSITQRRHYLRCCGEHHAKIKSQSVPVLLSRREDRRMRMAG